MYLFFIVVKKYFVTMLFSLLISISVPSRYVFKVFWRVHKYKYMKRIGVCFKLEICILPLK